jgi:hypothetical protein
MRYALATLDPTYFRNGNVRRQAEYAILTMDNLGYQVPYGDTGSFQCWWTEIPFLRGAAFYERDGRYAWTLFKEGQGAAIPPYCELEAAADVGQYGLSQTVVRNYNGVDWHRAILWNKEKFFLVVDDLVARESGEYDFHCLWHTVGEARLAADGLEVDQQGPRFFIKNGPGVDRKLSDNAELGRNWSGYQFAKPVVHSLRQVKSARLGKGQRVGSPTCCTRTTSGRPGSSRSPGRIVAPFASGPRKETSSSSPAALRAPRGRWHRPWPACGSSGTVSSRRPWLRAVPKPRRNLGPGRHSGPSRRSPSPADRANGQPASGKRD